MKPLIFLPAAFSLHAQVAQVMLPLNATVSISTGFRLYAPFSVK
jgi:hypothetical protein